MEAHERERHIAHLHIPDFYTSMEELRHPELRRRPLVLAEPRDRAVLQGVNVIARREGLREGMPLTLAHRLCRRVVALPPDLRFYGERHERLTSELGRFSPLVEGPFPGNYFVDLTGTRRLWGPSPDTACRMEQDLASYTGLHARVGLASNKLVSQVASTCVSPGDLSCIFPGGEASFLFPLPVTFLPGVGDKTASRLTDLNILSIGLLAALPAEGMSSIFGKTGLRLLKLAQGIDPTPVFPSRKAPRLNLVRKLDKNEIDREKLESVLFQQVEEAGWNLRRFNRLPGRFALEIRYADGQTARVERALPAAALQVDQRLFRAVLTAFRNLFQRRVSVRRLVLELSDFSMPYRQLSLFPWEETTLEGERKIQTALDTIRQRFGRTAIAWGRSLMVEKGRDTDGHEWTRMEKDKKNG